jgi:DNA modification methylase
VNTAKGTGWELRNGDCVELLRSLPDNSVDYSVFSPPFNSLYAYSDDPRDLSNCDNTEQFFEHFGFVMRELARVIKPGRLVSQHVMTLPTSKAKDGHIGLYDFGGDVIRAAEKAGFYFHSKVTIWKCPVVAMTRTKAIGLLYKQLIKDSAMSRQGIPDEVLTFRKPGDNEEPVTHEKPSTGAWPDVDLPQEQTIDKGGDVFPVSLWQKWASPVWMDIDQSDVLPARAAKDEDDQKHLCPLQLEVIRRCIRLWSNRGDIVLSPFAGIGSELYVALQEGRRAIGAELKPSYWRQAVANLEAVERRTGDLFAGVGT